MIDKWIRKLANRIMFGKKNCFNCKHNHLKDKLCDICTFNVGHIEYWEKIDDN